MDIKKITSEDIEKIALIFMEVFNKEPWEDGWNEENAKLRIEQIFNTPEFVGYFATKGNKIVGAVLGNITQSAKCKCYYMYEFFTIEEVRRQGVGQQLYDILVEALKEKECELIFLTTKRDSAAYKLYLKNKLIDLSASAVMIGRI